MKTNGRAGARFVKERWDKRQKIDFRCDRCVLQPAAEAFVAALRQLGQLATFAQDDARHHLSQGVQMAGHIPLRLDWIQLLHGLSFGTIHPTGRHFSPTGWWCRCGSPRF